jgi:hypothetical protein
MTAIPICISLFGLTLAVVGLGNVLIRIAEALEKRQ